MFRTRFLLAAALATLALTSGSSPAQTPGKGGGERRADFVMVSMNINETARTVTATVRLDGTPNTPGLRAVPVRLRVAGGGKTFVDETRTTDMPMGSTKTVTFANVNVAAIKAQVRQQPLQAVRFVSVSATIDPANAVAEPNEGNNTALRILPAN